MAVIVSIRSIGTLLDTSNTKNMEKKLDDGWFMDRVGVSNLASVIWFEYGARGPSRRVTPAH